MSRTGRRYPLPLWAEVPLVLVSVATVFGFARVYEGWSFLVPLLGFALGAHAIAVVTRRRSAPGWLVVALALGGAAVAVAWILFPATTSWGLPTGATWTAAADSLDVAREQYPVVIAPAPVLPGFQLAAGLALWLAAWFADWTAHRLRAIAEAVASTTAIFVFCAVLGSGRYELVCASAFAASVLAFIAVQRSFAIRRDQGWLPTSRSTASAVLRTAGAVGAVAVLLGSVIGPRLPGAGQEAAITWRGSSGDDPTRVTVSPMVELQKRLVQQSDRELFRVRSSRPAYWRLTSLDAFDGEIWSSSGDFSEADGTLPSDAPTGARGPEIRQEFTIEALAALWAPSAFEATRVSGSETPLRWDAGSSTLIVDASEPTSDGLDYDVVSRAPDHRPSELEAASGRDPKAIAQRYLELPAAFPFRASDLARRVTRGAGSRYARALALQEFFRTEFDYSLDVPAGHSDDALVAFLDSGEGYCEQFAGAFAAMARSLGMPARVAVGFTPGNTTKADPQLYRVYGRHAHAWPEVYFPGVGWVPFEPTPGRGMPDAQGYTGVAPQQNEARPVVSSSTTTTTAPTTTAPQPGDEPRTTPTRPPATERTEAAAGASEAEATKGSGRGPLPVVVAAVVLAGAAALVVVRRRRAVARRAATTESDAVWADIEAILAARRDVEPVPNETPTELATRVGRELADEDPAAAVRLDRAAALVTEGRWSADGLDAPGLDELRTLADQLRSVPESSSASSSSAGRSRLRMRSPVSPK